MFQKVKISDIALFVRGVSYKKEQAQKISNDGYTAILRANNISSGRFLMDDLVYVPNYLVKHEQFINDGDIVITMSSGSKTHVGKVAIANSDMRCAFGAFCGKLVPHDVLPQYLYYTLMSARFRSHIEEQSKGTNINNLKQDNILDYEIILPTLEKQQYIVDRIEELFSELDSGVETLKTVKAQLKVYRQAVLKGAYSSEYSARTVELSEVVSDIRIGPFGTMLHKSDYISGGVPVINPQHIKNNVIVHGASVTISPEKAEELSAYKLHENDIIMGRRGEMGRTASITSKEKGWICGTGSILLRMKPEFDATFYSKLLSSPDTIHYLEEHATGTTMKNLNEDIVRHIPVPFITAEMQAHIAADIDNKMSVCDEIEYTVDIALQQAKALRQSILKKAFKGGL